MRIVSIGEALIDFIPNKKGCALKDVSGFTRACGGAPANCAAAAAKLGAETALISCVGNDSFGEFITETLSSVGIDTSYIVHTDKANTTLAFVSLKADGNRDFSFYRNPGADMLLNENDITDEALADCGILHFGSVDLIEAPVKYAHKKAISIAKKNNAIISFDPNIRLPLWDSPESCLKSVRSFMPLADVVKISDDELAFITGIENEEKAIESLFEQGAKLILYSLGAKGARLITKKHDVYCPSIDVEVADTTGAGDSCMGSLLFCLAKDEINPQTLNLLSPEKLLEYLRFSVAYSTCSVMNKGAISSYVSYNDTIKFISERM